MIYSLPKTNAAINFNDESIETVLTNTITPNWQHRDLLYGQVILQPKNIDLGNLTGNREETIELWNVAGQDVTLLNVIGSGASGLNLVGKSSGLIINGETIYYTLQASPKGSSTINARYDYNFANTTFNTALTITGTRTPLFDYELEWSSGQVVSYKHLTNILESFNGQEERHGLTENPRLAFEYSYALTGKNRRDFENLIYSSQNAVFQVPLYHQRAEIKQDAYIGENVIYINNLNTDVQQGFNLYIGDFENNQIVKIESFDEITGAALLENNLIQDVSFGDSCYLMAPCRLSTSINLNSQIRDFTTTQIRFDVEDNSILNVLHKDDNLEIYDGLKVLYQKPSIDVSVDRTFDRKVDILDNNTGIRTYYNQDSTPALIQRYYFDVYGATAIAETIAFFENSKGRLNEFLLTSGVKDIEVIDDILATETTIIIEDNGQVNFNDNIQKNKIRVELSDGSVYYKTILNIEPENDYLRLFLDSNFEKDIFIDDILNVDFLANGRLNNDELQVNYITSEFAQISVDVKILRDI